MEILWIEFRTLCVLSRHPTVKPYPSPRIRIFDLLLKHASNTINNIRPFLKENVFTASRVCLPS